MTWGLASVTAFSYYRGTITGSFVPVTTDTKNIAWVRFTHPEGALTAGNVNLTNTAGDPIISDASVAPGVGFKDFCYFEDCVGLRIKATGATGIRYVIAYT